MRLGDPDVPDAEPVPVWMSRDQLAYWSRTNLTIDVVSGRGSGFSLEDPASKGFLIRSRLLTAPDRS